MSDYANVDCAEGRRLGCQTFCCRLVVRLEPDERGADGHGTVAKSADGYCEHLDRENYRCKIWAQRSRVCRGYTCNGDFLLQVALRNKFNGLVELVRLAAAAYIPIETYISIPSVQVSDNKE